MTRRVELIVSTVCIEKPSVRLHVHGHCTSQIRSSQLLITHLATRVH